MKRRRKKRKERVCVYNLYKNKWNVRELPVHRFVESERKSVLLCGTKYIISLCIEKIFFVFQYFSIDYVKKKGVQ
jgi:hypothetical protein